MTSRNEWINNTSVHICRSLFGDWATVDHETRERVCDAVSQAYDKCILPRLDEAWTEGRESAGLDMFRPLRADRTRAGSVSPYAPF